MNNQDTPAFLRPSTLRPPERRHAHSGLSGPSTRAAGAVLAGRTDAAGARNVPPVLELLVNLSCADPHAIAGWLTNGSADWSPGSALAGLEAELNNRDEKVRENNCGVD